MTDSKIRFDIGMDVEYNIRKNDFSMPHTHTFWEVVFIAEGAIFNRIGDETQRIAKHCAVLIKPDDVHSIRVAEADPD